MRLGLLVFALLFIFSCAPLAEREARKDSEQNLKQPILYHATGDKGDRVFYVNLRADNSFDFYEKNKSEPNYNFYAGTYVSEGETLRLAFHNNRHPKGISNIGTIDTANKVIIIQGKKKKNDRRMVINSFK